MVIYTVSGGSEKHTYAHGHNTKPAVSTTALHLMQQCCNTASSCLLDFILRNINEHLVLQMQLHN